LGLLHPSYKPANRYEIELGGYGCPSSQCDYHINVFTLETNVLVLMLSNYNSSRMEVRIDLYRTCMHVDVSLGLNLQIPNVISAIKWP